MLTGGQTMKEANVAFQSDDLTAPLPFFQHAPSRRILYIAAGPSPLVFSIGVQDVGGHAPVTATVGTTLHPFGRSTAVASLATSEVRQELAEAGPMQAGILDESLASWASFCDDVADRLSEGEELQAALETTWLLRDANDVDLDDEDPPTQPRGSVVR